MGKISNIIESGGFSPTSLSVMQNIQDVNYNCVGDGQMLLDPTLHDTVLNRTNEDKEFMKSLQSEKDDDYASFEELQKAFDSLGPDTGYEPKKNVRTMNNLIERHDISSYQIDVDFQCTSLQSLNPPLDVLSQIDSMLLIDNVEEFKHVNHLEENPLLIKYIAYGLLDTSIYDQNIVIQTETDSKANMKKFAESIPLDFKQTAAFEVMSCSYLLKALETNNINVEQIQKCSLNINQHVYQKRKI